MSVLIRPWDDLPPHARPDKPVVRLSRRREELVKRLMTGSRIEIGGVKTTEYPTRFPGGRRLSYFLSYSGRGLLARVECASG